MWHADAAEECIRESKESCIVPPRARKAPTRERPYVLLDFTLSIRVLVSESSTLRAMF